MTGFPFVCWAERFLRDREDYRQVLPAGLPEIFTSSHLARAARLSPNSASRAMNVFFSVQAVDRVGKQGNHYCYRMPEENLTKEKDFDCTSEKSLLY